MDMVNKKDWKEFRDSGFLWWINMLLHTFGWAIVFEYEEDVIINVYPARVRFRGFDEKNNTMGYQKVSEYMFDNSEDLFNEAFD